MIWLLTFYIITIFLPLIEARIHPIEIRGNHFYDSVTNKPVSILTLKMKKNNYYNISIVQLLTNLNKFYNY